MRDIFLAVSLTACLGGFLCAAEAPKSAPPEGFDFVRQMDIEGFVQQTNRGQQGAQSGRIRMRYLDTDVNAFVGLMTGIHRFNEGLTIKNPADPDTANYLWNWGGDLGIIRGRHLWELDLMGVALGNSLGPALAVVGEHQLSRRWTFYHRTEVNLFTGDAILDADQGVYWWPWKSFGIALGYRWFTSQHMDRSGPHVGATLRFESPKIPFLFPSLG